MRIDNATAEPLQIWIDGKRSFVASSSLAGAPSTLRLSHGSHVLGWSKVGASAPERTTQAQIDPLGDHLYAPGPAACYFQEVSVYGVPRSSRFTDGPLLPVREFYTFTHMDNWFENNPAKVEVKSGDGGVEKVAVRRAEICAEMTSPPCPAGVRDRYWQCMSAIWQRADGQVQADACAARAAAECFPGSASSPK